jgi:putative spermidine/putrescine transport system ATP-binding protein
LGRHAAGVLDVQDGSKPFLELSEIDRSFGGVKVIRGVSLQLERGEFVTLLGPSGSGKSTTLNLVAGFDFSDGGTIRLAGRDITRAPAHTRDVGMVFQSYALFPHLTIAENVAFALRVRRCPGPDIARRVKDALVLVRMSAFAERDPGQLSGGQAQRVSIARAIVYRPDLLLMDEPLSALDRKLRAEMQFELKTLHRTLGTTVLYVTHDQEEALAMSDRIAVLDDGTLVQCARPNEIYECPRTRFVADFIGETNFLEAEAVLRDNQWLAHCTQLGLDVPLANSSTWSANQRLTLCVRPEHVQIHPPSASGQGMQVLEVQYLGDAVRCRLKHADTSLTAKLTGSPDLELLQPGALVAVTVDGAKSRVFVET